MPTTTDVTKPRPNLLLRAIALWILGLVTIVPYGTYYLFFEATRDQYALLITLVLFWIFGYWGVVGPLLAALRIRAVLRAIEQARTQGNLREVLASAQTQQVAIDIIAADNGIPRFVAAWLLRLMIAKLQPPRTSG